MNHISLLSQIHRSGSPTVGTSCIHAFETSRTHLIKIEQSKFKFSNLNYIIKIKRKMLFIPSTISGFYQISKFGRSNLQSSSKKWYYQKLQSSSVLCILSKHWEWMINHQIKICIFSSSDHRWAESVNPNSKFTMSTKMHV